MPVSLRARSVFVRFCWRSIFLLIEILKVMNRYTIESCVRGYHVYKDIWEARVGEELSCEREIGNSMDPANGPRSSGTLCLGQKYL